MDTNILDEQLENQKKKKKKIIKSIIIIIIIFIIIFAIGVIGYGYFFNMNFVDAIFNTSLTMSNLGIAPHEKTVGEKLFTASYSIISGIFFLSLMGALIAYIMLSYI